MVTKEVTIEVVTEEEEFKTKWEVKGIKEAVVAFKEETTNTMIVIDNKSKEEVDQEVEEEVPEVEDKVD